MPALTGPAQHQARVAANLVGIVERELRLAPEQAAREIAALRAVLPHADPTDLVDARAQLAAALRAGFADDPAVDVEAWGMLFASVRDDLAICKPGHDVWQGD